MKKTILISTLALIFTLALHTFSVNSGYAGESKKAGVIFVYSNSPNAAGSYCGPVSGSFTTGSDGFKKLSLPNGTYTICVSGSGGGVAVVVVTESTTSVTCTNGAPCPNCIPTEE